MRDGQGWDVDGLTVALAEAEAVIEGLTYENERLRAAVQAVRDLCLRHPPTGTVLVYLAVEDVLAALGGERDE